MNKKVLKYITLGIGCGCGATALFNIINAIFCITYINVDNQALINVGLIMRSVVGLAAACGFGLLCYVNVMAFVNDKESKYQKYPVSLFGVVIALSELVNMIFFYGYQDALCYVLLVLAASVIVVFVLALLQEDKKNALILDLVAAGIAFTVAVVSSSYNGGWGLACDLFSMFTIMGVIGYLVCLVIINNNKQPKETKTEEVKEEAKAEEVKEEKESE